MGGMQIKIASTLSQLTQAKDIIALLLKERGIDPTSAESFFKPTKPDELSLSEVGLSLAEFEKAYERLQQALKKQESVVVYTDYDVDGITGGAILWQTLHEIGFKAMPYIPDRKTEGYGFSRSGIDKIMKEYNPTVVISVDHGISGEEHIKTLQSMGVDVIVCDHHVKLLGDPESAYAIMYSKQICGAGVSYFFSKEIARRHKVFEHFFEHDFIVLAGIGTISDIMPLVGPSRSLAYYGLKYMKSVQSIGLKELMIGAKIQGKEKYSAYDVGFVIGPRINAAGRMGDAMDALRLLCSKNVEKAKALATVLQSKNSLRQSKVEEQLSIAHGCLAGHEEDRIIFVHSPLFEEGTAGLVAAKLMEKYYRPVLVAVESDGHLKGSARSIEGVDVTDIFKSVSGLLESYGGHERAGGFLLLKENIEALREALQKYGKKKISANTLERSITADLATPLHNITLELAKELQHLEPFGVANEEPVFLTRSAVLQFPRLVGKNQNHLQCSVLDATSRKPIKAIFFNGVKQMELITKGEPLDVLYTVGIDSWRDEQVAIHIKDVFPVATS